MAIIYGLKVNLSIAIVSMVNHTAIELAKVADNSTAGGHHGGSCPAPDNMTDHANDTGHTAKTEDGPFNWSSSEQGMVLSSYFLGYFVTQIPGGRLAELYSAKLVFLVAVLMNALGTVVTPGASLLGYPVLMVARIFEGFGGGVTFPAMNVLIAKWSPSE